MLHVARDDSPSTGDSLDLETLVETLRRACKTVAPVWPLESFVAVNPYLGMIDRTFEEVAQTLALTAAARTTMPASFYLEALERGRIDEEDLEAALAESPFPLETDVDSFIRWVRAVPEPIELNAQVPTVADVASMLTGYDWAHLARERVAAWAAAYFDEGQALWSSAACSQSVFAAWRAEACVDRTAEVMGLPGFRSIVKSLPKHPLEAARVVLEKLGVPEAGLDLYLQRLLLRVGGWAAYAARFAWEAELRGSAVDTLLEFLIVLLSWEAALLASLQQQGLVAAWQQARQKLASLSGSVSLSEGLARLLVLQAAFDRTAQRRLLKTIASVPASQANSGDRPSVQALFCIDVRSEVFRRHLEAVAPGVATIGCAGFFGFPIRYVPIGHGEGEAQCPVLLTPQHTILEVLPDPSEQERTVARRRLKHHVARAWTSFKMGAISCFSFVGPVGLAYLPKLFTDAFGLTRPVPPPDKEGLTRKEAGQKVPSLAPGGCAHPHVGIPLEARLKLAAGALQAMSLTEGFAPLVMLAGHGSTTVNNPHATGLDCGACGGHTGEANARVAAAVLNDREVRKGLARQGIVIPEDTFFLASLHDTTTDEVTVFDRDLVPPSHARNLDELERWLAETGRLARAERARRLNIPSGVKVDATVRARSKDWSQVRPEWGLAGCSTFIVAPRERTAGLNLQGRAFLHSYDWTKDETFSILELIMTAPMVVASWISLQYYASTVENRLFGSGNKTLHNVVGKVGVLEGNGGDLRVGLPWQSVHDGQRLQHEPLRLMVVIEAPRVAVQNVIEKHAMVRDLVTNGWLALIVRDDEQWYRWTSGGHWQLEDFPQEFTPAEERPLAVGA